MVESMLQLAPLFAPDRLSSGCARRSRRPAKGSLTMANKKHVELLRQGVKAWNAWREKEPSVKPDLSGANLRGANLRRANLKTANLWRADLRKANLSKAALFMAGLF